MVTACKSKRHSFQLRAAVVFWPHLQPICGLLLGHKCCASECMSKLLVLFILFTHAPYQLYENQTAFYRNQMESSEYQCGVPQNPDRSRNADVGLAFQFGLPVNSGGTQGDSGSSERSVGIKHFHQLTLFPVSMVTVHRCNSNRPCCAKPVYFICVGSCVIQHNHWPIPTQV